MFKSYEDCDADFINKVLETVWATDDPAKVPKKWIIDDDFKKILES